MARTTREYKFELGEKLQKRWEKEYPEMRCVMLDDPSRGGDYKTVSKYQKLGYREIPLSSEERLALMDTEQSILMGMPVKKWEQSLKDTSYPYPDVHEEVRTSV